MLPKIDKDQPKWRKPYEIPPGRPIVSDCGHETYYTAEFLDFYLNPLSIGHPSYIRDTYDFVHKVKGLKISQKAILFTMDIDSLYININIQEGIQAIKNIFEKTPDAPRPDKELIQLVEINLNRNDFAFNGIFFYKSKAQRWARSLPQPTPTFLWQNGRLQHLPDATNSPFTILDI